MIKIRPYNTKIKKIDTWKISDKKESVEIFDEKNGFVFEIEFGNHPKISIHEMEKGEVLDLVAELEV